MIFVEAIMDPYDSLAPITISSNKGAELDYGPRGPQRRDNVQLKPVTLDTVSGIPTRTLK
jgi:indolepyruvate decarboxylase